MTEFDTPAPPIRLGVIGLGRAFTLMLPSFLADPRVTLVAAADPRPEARERFTAEFGAPAYATDAELCADPAVQAVYIASPHQFHAANVATSAAAGKHILVEKPMALSLDECQAMVAATDAAGVHLIVGHSHSFDAPIRHARSLIAGGSLGALRMIQASYYTDFLYRPRRPEELDTRMGGGVVFNQAPHQIDVVRLLGGGQLARVRALTGNWDPARPTEGAYAALLTFTSGAFASLTYSGYAHFDGDELCDWFAESGQPKDPALYGTTRAELRAVADPAAELALRTARAYGTSPVAAPKPGRQHQHFGLVIASCDGADLRPLPDRVIVYGDTKRIDRLPAPSVFRAEVIDELVDAVWHDRRPLHDAAWGLATMEACFALLESAATGQDSILRHWQEAVPNDRLAHLVRDAARGLTRALTARLADHNVSFGHWTFLRVLWAEDGLTQRELSERAGLMEPTTFTALQAMERLGYIRREQRPGNRRKIYIHLTDTGHALAQTLVPLAEAINAIAVRGADPADVATTRALLLHMIRNLAEDAA